MTTLSLLVSCIISLSVKASGDTTQLETITLQKSKHTTEQFQVNNGTETKHGFYKVLYDGQTLINGFYMGGKKSGTWKYFYSQDSLQATGNYTNGEKDGSWICYYKNGSVSSKANYSHDERTDEYIKYYPDGTKKEVCVPGLMTYYYKNGKVSEEVHLKNGYENGPAKKYYDTGVLKESRNMKNGLRDSVYLFYYEDGTLWEHILYREGGIWNVIAYQSPDGKPLNCCTVKDGNGIMRFYDREGKVVSETEYKNAQKNGMSKRFGKAGLLHEGNFLNGHETGLWKFYNLDGTPNKDCYFVEGKEEGQEHNYYPSGKLKSAGLRKGRNLQGEWINYEPDGKISSILNYENDTLEGLARYFFRNKVQRAGKYHQGQKDGIWVHYDAKEKVDSKEEFTFKPAEKVERKESMVHHENGQRSLPDEKQPEFPGGEQALFRYLSSQIKYPPDSKDDGIQGTVVLTFIVSHVGEVTDVKIQKSVAADLDKESMRVVLAMPRWVPATMNEIPVAVQYRLPVQFSLR